MAEIPAQPDGTGSVSEAKTSESTRVAAGATALVFQAGRLVLLDRDEVVDFADRHGIAVVGVDSGLPAAPLRPAE